MEAIQCVEINGGSTAFPRLSVYFFFSILDPAIKRGKPLFEIRNLFTVEMAFN